jgi:hypothetical protein
LILRYYETTDTVRLALSGRNAYIDNSNGPFEHSGIDVNKYENEGSLITMDSLKRIFSIRGTKRLSR